MKVLNKDKLLDFMTQRVDSLYEQITRDFSGGLRSPVFEHREAKYWKEAIERGEFEGVLENVYVILCQDHPEIADFTYFTDEETVSKRVDELNMLSRSTKYWYITLYGNVRNSIKSVPEKK